MTIPKLLDRGADIAEIVTAVVAVWAALSYRRLYGRKIKEIEAELKRAWKNDPKQAGRTTLHLVVKTGLTEKEILAASLKSHFIRRHGQHGQDGQTAKVLLVYDPEGKQNRTVTSVKTTTKRLVILSIFVGAACVLQWFDIEHPSTTMFCITALNALATCTFATWTLTCFWIKDRPASPLSHD